jgi:hypothetical protein
MNPFKILSAYKPPLRKSDNKKSPALFRELEDAFLSFHLGSYKKILLISDGPAIGLHFDTWLKNQLEKESFQVLLYQLPDTVCHWKDVGQAAALFKQENCDMLLGCGTSASANCTKLAAASTILPDLQKSPVFFSPQIDSPLPYFGWMPFGYLSGMEASGQAFYQTGSMYKTVHHPALSPSFLLMEKNCFQAISRNILQASLHSVAAHVVENYCTCTLSLEERQNIRIAIRLLFEVLKKEPADSGALTEVLFEAYWVLVQTQAQKPGSLLGLIDELLCMEENACQHSFLPSFLSCLVSLGNETLCEELHELGILAKTSSSLSEPKNGAKDFIYALQQIAPKNEIQSIHLFQGIQLEKIYEKIRPYCKNSKLAYRDIQAIARAIS